MIFSRFSLLLNRVARALGGLVAIILAARSNNEEVGAQIVMILNVFSFFIPLLIYGMNTLYASLPNSSTKNSKTESTVIGNFLIINLLLVSVTFIIVHLNDWPFWYFYAVILLSISRLPDLLRVVLESRGQQHLYIKNEIIASLIYVLFVSILLFQTDDYHPMVAISVVALQGLMLIPFYHGKVIFKLKDFDKDLFKSIIKRGLYLTFSALLFAVASRIDLLIINQFLNAADVVRYGVLLKLIEIFVFAPIALWALTHVKVVQENSEIKVRKYYLYSILETISFTTIILTILIYFNSEISNYLTIAEFKNIEFIAIMIIAIFAVMGAATNSLLTRLNDEREILIKTLFTTSISFLCMFIIYITSQFYIISFLLALVIVQIFSGLVYDYLSKHKIYLVTIKWSLS